VSGSGAGAAGDLGRRVRTRREELGLSVDALASRAGMSPNYLRTLESTASLQPSRAGMWNLAAALDCPLGALTGSGMESPPGRPQPASRQHIETLTSDECTALVAPGGIGRFVFLDERGPVAWPVNFRILDGDVVFRTESESSVLKHLTQGDTSFEVDRLDEALTEGWSVLMTGQSRVIDDPAERGRAESLGVQPWATGPHDAYVRLSPRTITGRRIRREHAHG
jgi:transcriptional regulator with XRE-family HTH domain